jgi:S-adenosyl methyltransferase
MPASGGSESWMRLDPDQLPAEIDTSVAHPARVYDYWLGGKDNFPADRALGDAIMAAVPTIQVMARANRAFLSRAVRYLAAEAGIRQFLDIGTGIPTVGNTHEVAQKVAPEARVVYVDNDPIVLVHARALMTGNNAGATAFIEADLREPRKILADPALAATLDLGQPVALMLVAVLMYFRDEEDPQAMVAALVDALPSGSYLAITHPTADFDAEAMAGAVAAAEHGGITLVPRSRAETEVFFTGLDLVEPGVVPVLAWRPDDGPPADPHSAYYYAGIGRKP